MGAASIDLRKRIIRLAWRSFAILSGCFLLVSFFRTSASTLAVDMMRDFQVGSGLMAVMSSAFFYPYGLMQLPAGVMADRWGARAIISAFLAVGGLGAVIFAFADGVGMATTGRIIMGLGMGMVYVPSLKVLFAWFPREKYVMSIGLYLSVGAFGMIAASWPLAVLAEHTGWRAAILGVAAITLLVALAVWLFIRNTPQELGLAFQGSPVQKEEKGRLSLYAVAKILAGRRDYWLLCLWLFAIYGAFYSLTGLWAGPYFSQAYGLGAGGAGFMLSMLAAGGIISPTIAGWLAWKCRVPKKTILIMASGGTIICSAPLLISYPVVPGAVLPVWCFFLGFFYGGFGCIAMAWIQELVPAAILGTATGLANVFSYAGSTTLQLVSGFWLQLISRQSGNYEIQHYAGMFRLFILAAVLALVCVIICRKDGA